MKITNYFFVCLFFLSVIGLTAQKQDPVIDQDNSLKAQVISQDLVVQGSECVGIDCANGESFGFDTERYKENNLRIHFDDTSNSSSFPSNDWRIEINDSSNGGSNYFAIQDATAGRQVFRVDAGAPLNALRINNAGNIGVGTASPIVEVHVVDGDSPTFRLEQDGSAGFTAQTWDIAGNETNFFVRDATNGSLLPFKIKPGTPTNTLFLAASGNVGIRTDSPDASLHLKHPDPIIKVEETSTTRSGRTLLHLINYGSPRFVFEHSEANIQWSHQISNNGKYRLSVPGLLGFELDNTNGNIAFSGDVTANGVTLTSDLRLKKDVTPFEAGLEEILKINPINYRFNGKAGFKNTRPFIGYAAQELQEVAPYLVHDFQVNKEDEDTNILSSETYLKIDPIAVQVLLVNAVKEQNEIIEEKEDRIYTLENEVSELKQQMDEILTLLKDKESQDVTLSGNNTLLKQNYPNPHNGQTVIEYFIPENSNSAKIQFFDNSGKLLKEVSLNEKGSGQLNIESNNFPNGQYTYSLLLDGKITSSKKMTLQK